MTSLRHSRFFLLSRPLLHAVGIIFAYWIVAHMREYTDLIPFVQLRIPTIDLSETMWFAALSSILFVMIAFFQEQYALFRPKNHGYGSFVQARLLRVMISGFFAWMGFGYVFVSGISRFVVIIASGVSLFVLTLADLLRSWIGRKQGATLEYRLLVAAGDLTQSRAVAAEFTEHSEYIVTPISLEQLDRYADAWDGCVLVGSTQKEWFTHRYETARINGKDVYQLAEGHFLDDTFGVPMTVGPLVVTARRTSPLSERRRVVKRGADIIISGLGLLLLSPIFLIIAVVIKRDSPGPVFYTQSRVGKQKQLFRFVKFRSMFTHLSTGSGYGGEQAQALYEKLIASDQNVRVGILPKIAHDPRVTRVGAFLRKTSLDELPSLWSVLMGDMSLVGPRPHLPREVDQYADRHQRLFQVKPGITGYAQLHGRDKVPFDEEAKLDLRYINNRSLWLDLYVLFATIKVVFGGK